MKKGKVYIVGAGPGDPELITLKGVRVLQLADLVLFDELAGDGWPSLVKEGTAIIYVGKRKDDGADQQARLKKITGYYDHYHREGKTVIRLKGGDPMVFARTGEEIQYLKSYNIPFEVVPGITAAMAGAAAACFPLTLREKSQQVAFITASSVNEDYHFKEQFLSLLQGHGTVVVYMGTSMLFMLFEWLMTRAKSESVHTEMVAVSQASLPGQTINRFSTDSATIPDFNSVSLPSVILVRDIV